jgi:hypothetical protein
LGKKERGKMLENCGSLKDKIQEYTLGKNMKKWRRKCGKRRREVKNAGTMRKEERIKMRGQCGEMQKKEKNHPGQIEKIRTESEARGWGRPK